MSLGSPPVRNKATSSLSISVRRFSTSALHTILLTSIPIYRCTYYAGGTNLRVCLVNVQGDGKFEITQSKYRLTEEQKQDEGQKLFDFCAESLKTFINTNLADELKPGDVLPLGFTVWLGIFLFPISGHSLIFADSSRTHARKCPLE